MPESSTELASILTQRTPGTNNGICVCKDSASYGFLITSWGLGKTGKSTHTWGQTACQIRLILQLSK